MARCHALYWNRYRKYTGELILRTCRTVTNKTLEKPEIPQNNWDKLPPEIRHMILDHFKYIHEPTKVTVFHLSQSHISLRRVVGFIENHRGELNTNIFNLMRVSRQWYCDIHRQYRAMSLITFYSDWDVYRSLEVLLTRPTKKLRHTERDISREGNWLAEDLEESDIDESVGPETLALRTRS